MRIRLLATALMLLIVSPVMAGNKIELTQSDGTQTELGGIGHAANVNLGSEDQTNFVVKTENQSEYETVAASQTNQMMGGTGAAGDYIRRVVCVATAASASAVTLKDGTLTAFNIFPTFSAAGIYEVPLDIISSDGGWQITTSTNTTCIGIGRFS